MAQMNTGRIAFRSLEETDLPSMFRWLNKPHVSQWYKIFGKRCPSHEEVRRKYLPRITGNDPTSCYVILYDGMPIGMVQSYLLDDYPVEKESFDLSQSCAGIDLFIGEEDHIHQGFGSTIIKKFLQKILFVKYDVDCYIVDPDPKNQVAIKAYQKSGFKYLKTVWNRQEGEHAHIMGINRDELLPSKRMSKRG